MGVGYVSTTDPKRAAQNQRDYLTQRGDDLTSQELQRQQREQELRQSTGDFLNTQYLPMATGNGGYSETEAAGNYLSPEEAAGNYLSPEEQAAIQDQGGLDRLDPNAMRTSQDFLSNYVMSPEERQDIVTGAGITAGNRYRSAIGDLERSSRAAGMNPGGVAAYRARMEREAAGEAGDAMTQARINASNAAASRMATGEQMRQTGEQNAFNAGLNKSNTESGRAATVATNRQGVNAANATNRQNANQTNANMRLNQQNQGLNYFAGQNQQANENENAAANRAAGIYGTQATGTNQAAGIQQAASQNPGTLQKVVGGISGALSAAAPFLEDGGIVDKPTLSIIGENGPEAVVPLSYRPQAKVRPSMVPPMQPRRNRFYGQQAA